MAIKYPGYVIEMLEDSFWARLSMKGVEYDAEIPKRLVVPRDLPLMREGSIIFLSLRRKKVQVYRKFYTQRQLDRADRQAARFAKIYSDLFATAMDEAVARQVEMGESDRA